MKNGVENWNTPWQILQRTLAEAFSHDPLHSAVSPSRAKPANSANWLVRAHRQASHPAR